MLNPMRYFNIKLYNCTNMFNLLENVFVYWNSPRSFLNLHLVIVIYYSLTFLNEFKIQK